MELSADPRCPFDNDVLDQKNLELLFTFIIFVQSWNVILAQV